MEFYTRLKSICVSKNTSISAILTKCGYSKSYGTNWKNGVIPTIDVIVNLAKQLNISVDYLLGIDTPAPKDETNLLNTYRCLTENGKKQVIDFTEKIADAEASTEFFIPTIKIKHSEYTVSAGIGDEIGDYEHWETVEIPKTREAVKADFCLTIKGNSMSPKFESGDVILVKDQPAVDIGEIGVFNVNNKGYIKKFDGDKLISLNPEYEDVVIPKDTDDIVECCGLVLGKTTIIE